MTKDWRDDPSISWRQHKIESVPRYERWALAKEKAKQAYLSGDLDRTMHYFVLHLRVDNYGPSGNLDNLFHALRCCTGKEDTYWDEFSVWYSTGSTGYRNGSTTLGAEFAKYFHLTSEEAKLAEERRVFSGKQNIVLGSWSKLRGEK